MGGMGGGMGGMGGGMGGYGGGMGGMGGGMMGGMGGGMMGGGMGGGMMGGGMGMTGYMSGIMAQSLRYLIEQTIEPDSWFDLSETGEGTITPYPDQQPKKLVVYQTPEVHQQIRDMLDQLRKSLGNEVSIEARFLAVTENFLEDIGLDLDFSYNLGGNWGVVTVEQDSFLNVRPTQTNVSGSYSGSRARTPAMGVQAGYGSVLDDLQVSLLLRATQGADRFEVAVGAESDGLERRVRVLLSPGLHLLCLAPDGDAGHAGHVERRRLDAGHLRASEHRVPAGRQQLDDHPDDHQRQKTRAAEHHHDPDGPAAFQTAHRLGADSGKHRRNDGPTAPPPTPPRRSSRIRWRFPRRRRPT